MRVAGTNCLVESAGYEGEFASVRRPLAWTKGTYTYQITKAQTEITDGKTNTWFTCRVQDPAGHEHEIGSLRFEGADFTFGRGTRRLSKFIPPRKFRAARFPRSP